MGIKPLTFIIASIFAIFFEIDIVSKYAIKCFFYSFRKAVQILKYTIQFDRLADNSIGAV